MAVEVEQVAQRPGHGEEVAVLADQRGEAVVQLAGDRVEAGEHGVEQEPGGGRGVALDRRGRLEQSRGGRLGERRAVPRRLDGRGVQVGRPGDPPSLPAPRQVVAAGEVGPAQPREPGDPQQGDLMQQPALEPVGLGVEVELELARAGGRAPSRCSASRLLQVVRPAAAARSPRPAGRARRRGRPRARRRAAGAPGPRRTRP